MLNWNNPQPLPEDLTKVPEVNNARISAQDWSNFAHFEQCCPPYTNGFDQKTQSAPSLGHYASTANGGQQFGNGYHGVNGNRTWSDPSGMNHQPTGFVNRYNQFSMPGVPQQTAAIPFGSPNFFPNAQRLSQPSQPPSFQLSNQLNPALHPDHYQQYPGMNHFSRLHSTANDQQAMRSCNAHDRQAHSPVDANRNPRDDPKICTYCKTEETPQWRRDDQNNRVCNACGLHLKKYDKPPAKPKSDYQRRQRNGSFTLKVKATGPNQFRVEASNREQSHIKQGDIVCVSQVLPC